MTTAVISNQLPALSSGSLNSYLDSIQQISLLTAEEEVGLFLRFQEYNDVEAARKIVLSHLRYVAYVAAASWVMDYHWKISFSRVTLD